MRDENLIEWYVGYFGEGTHVHEMYIDSHDRAFLMDGFVASENHNCDEMGCASCGPHIFGVYINAKKYEQLQAENEKMKDLFTLHNLLPFLAQGKCFCDPDVGATPCVSCAADEILRLALKGE